MTEKILHQSNLSALLDILRSNNQSIVFTNGCFDLLHPGHLEYLAKAKELGDALIVAVNDDDSVKGLKGESRPINTLMDRMDMLAGLEAVDFVISFSEDTPIKLIKQIQPQVLVKGGDYKKEEIVGASFTEENGGTISIIPFKEGYSSTALIERIKNS